MNTLAARVLEAIEADEAFAGLAGEVDDNWEYRRGVDKEHMPTDGSTYDGGISWHPGKQQVIYAYWEEDAEHIVRHQPSRVRRRCAADRKILALHQSTSETPVTSPGNGIPFICKTCGSGERYEYPTSHPCDTLIALAEAYGVPLEQEET